MGHHLVYPHMPSLWFYSLHWRNMGNPKNNHEGEWINQPISIQSSCRTPIIIGNWLVSWIPNPAGQISSQQRQLWFLISLWCLTGWHEDASESSGASPPSTRILCWHPGGLMSRKSAGVYGSSSLQKGPDPSPSSNNELQLTPSGS